MRFNAGRHGTERRTAVHDGNESDGQGQVQSVRRVREAYARWVDHHGTANVHLDRREEQNRVSRVVHPVQRGILESVVGLTGLGLVADGD